MSVRRTKIDGEAALMAQVAPNLWKVVYPNGKVSFFQPEAEASDADWDESQHPRDDRGKFTHGHGELSAEERDSVVKYAQTYFERVNRNLRLGSPLPEAHDKVRRGLDSLLQRSTLHTDVTLYRGVGTTEKTFGTLKEGDEVEDAGFMSMAPDSRTAYLFSKSTSGLMEISVPAGTHAFDVGAISGEEPEILLPRGTKLRYAGRGESPGEAYRNLPRTYKFEVVRAGALDWNPFQRRVPKGEAGGGQWSGENLTDRERQEVRHYTTEAYRHINSTLREGLAYVLDRTVPLLDSAIAKSVIGKDFTVFRGVDSDRFIAKLEGLQPGEEITDKAYTSASGSYLAANQYSGVGRPVMEIRIPKGSNVLYAESMSVSIGLGEEEYILPRNSTFRYVEKVGSAGATRYRFDLVRQSAKDADWREEQHPRDPRGKFTEAEHAAVSEYAGEGFADLNSRLRSGKMDAANTELMKHLDSAVAKSRLAGPEVLFRGVNKKFADQLRDGEVTEPAFSSFSRDFDTSSEFSSHLLQLDAPSGAHALEVDSVIGSVDVGQHELILPRGLTLKLDSTQKVRNSFGEDVTLYHVRAVNLAKDAYDPSEPRVPAGEPGGGQWRGENLTKRERAEVYHYTENGYSDINEVLRAGEQPSKYLQDSIDLLDSALAKSALTSDTVVYRGIGFNEFQAQLETLKTGEAITDAAFMSTSDSLETAAKFSGGPATVMEVRLPKGSSALYVEEFSANSGVEENEYILPRGATLRFVTSRVTKTKKTVYTFDLAPRAATDWNPFQPRVPKGEAGGGEWTEGGSTGGGKLSFVGNKPVGLQPVHVDAIRQYTASIYVPLNQGLRNKETLRTAEEQVMRSLDEAFDRLPRTTEVMQLFRAAGDEFSRYVDALKVGDDLTDPGFVSTSFDEKVAREFLSSEPGGNKVLLEIVLPKESRAIQTEKYNPFKGENETLLPRDTTFRYLGKERDVYRFRANPRPLAA